MARNYAALPYEYLEEMDALNDEEFGRLTRALLMYSMTGEPMALCGNERFYAKRVMMQEDRFQNSYNESTEAKSKAGKKGADARWNDSASAANGKNGNASGANSKNGKASGAMAPDGKNGYTKTETKTKTKTKTETNNEDENIAPARDVGVVGNVIADYMNRINPVGSQRSLDKLKGYAEVLGEDVCKRAFDIALDNKAANWPYIEGILRKLQQQGVRCLADWEELEERRRNKKNNSPSGYDYSDKEGSL